MTVTSIIPFLRGWIACRFCARWFRPGELIGNACRECARDNLTWLHDLGIRLAVPQGFRWPR